jgi:DNA-binding NarL/FixJ family response regulator
MDLSVQQAAPVRDKLANSPEITWTPKARAGSIVPSDFLADEESFRQKISDLTMHQRFILEQVARGQMNKQIAYDLGVAECTVKTHVTSILRRLGVASRTQAAVKYAVLIERQSSLEYRWPAEDGRQSNR